MRTHLTKDLVQKFRKDFLILVSNAKRLRTYDQALAWKVALRNWREYFESVLYQIREDIEGRIRQDKGKPAYDRRVSEDWATYYLNHMTPVWTFAHEAASVEIPSIDTAKKYHSATFDEAQFFERVMEEVRKWDQRVRRKAQIAWKWMDDFVDWTIRADLSGGGGDPAQIQFRENVNARIEGFAVRVIGFEEGERFHQEHLEKLKEGLSYYRRRATQVYPWVLKYALPLEAYFTGGNTDAAGVYNGDHIELSFWALSNKPKEFAHVVAHEMGHHIWRTVLSGEAQAYWKEMATSQHPLDLRDVMHRMKPGESTWDLGDRIKTEEPVLYLQLETLLHDNRYKALDLLGIQSIQEYLEGGGDPVMMVPINPVTGYGAKNPEEAFCETLGLLVGYGPQALLPEIRSFLHALVPGVKISTMAKRVAFLFVAQGK